jgi:hypothetical protein
MDDSIPTLKEYTVRWEIGVDATSMEDAARIVNEHYFVPGNEAVGFDVRESGELNDFWFIDLAIPEKGDE